MNSNQTQTFRNRNSITILGLDKYYQVVNKFPSIAESIQTIVYQKIDDIEVDIDFIVSFVIDLLDFGEMKLDEEQQKDIEEPFFTESVFDDFKKMSQTDSVVKPKAKSLLDESEGITRIIDMLESHIWSDQEMVVQEKSKNEVSSTKLNIHQKTYEMNKETRENYEKQLKSEQNEDEEIETTEKTKAEEENTADKNEQQQQNKETKEQVQEDNKTDQKQQDSQSIEKQDTQKEKLDHSEKNKETLTQEKKPTDTKDKTKAESKQANSKDDKNTKKKEQKFTDEDDEEIQENTMNDFVKILEQMKGMKQNTTNMSDDQRKDQAEKFVLGLMQAFGLDEESDEDK